MINRRSTSKDCTPVLAETYDIRNFKADKAGDVATDHPIAQSDSDASSAAKSTAFMALPYAAFVLDWSGQILAANRRARVAFLPDYVDGQEEIPDVLFAELTEEEAENVPHMLRSGAVKGVVSMRMRARANKPQNATTTFRASLIRRPEDSWHKILLTQDQLKATAKSLSYMNARRIEAKSKAQHFEAALMETQQRLISTESFARAASHDLRTPINTLSGLLQMLESEMSEAQTEQWADHIRFMTRAVEQMNTLTSSLLEHSVSSAAAIEVERVSVKEVLDETLDDLKSQIESCGAKVERIGPDAKVPADRILMRILFTNLLSNAIKYRDPNRPLELQLEMSRDLAGNPIFRIQDNGVGFNPNDAKAILQPFHRLNKNVDGTGIGLATCVEVCRRHDWDLTAHGAVDNGATFEVHFRLPPDV